MLAIAILYSLGVVFAVVAALMQPSKDRADTFPIFVGVAVFWPVLAVLVLLGIAIVGTCICVVGPCWCLVAIVSVLRSGRAPNVAIGSRVEGK